MAKFTTNLNLEKPLDTEYYDIGVFNSNADKVDEAVNSRLIKNPAVTPRTAVKVTYDAKGLITGSTALTAADIPNLTLVKITDVGNAASKNTGTAAGQIPLLNAEGKLPDSVLPSLSIVDVFEVDSESAMLALSAQAGDIAVRNDIFKSFILKSLPANNLANWIELKTPTDAVTSVNGKIGVVVLDKSDVGLSEVDNVKQAPLSVFERTLLYCTGVLAELSSKINDNFQADSDTSKKLAALDKNTFYFGGKPLFHTTFLSRDESGHFYTDENGDYLMTRACDGRGYARYSPLFTRTDGRLNYKGDINFYG